MTALLWIRSDTTNGDTDFEDSSASGRTISEFGNAQHLTAQKKFNATSMNFDGTGDYLTLPSSTDFDFGTDDFSIHFWLYVTSIPAYDMIIGRLDSWGDSGQFWIRMHPGNSGLEAAVGNAYFDISSLPLSQWNHIALTRSSGTARFFLNGAVSDSGSATYSIDSTDDLYIARNPVNSAEELVGYLEEILIDDTALWAGAFTPESGGISTAPSPLSGPDITGTIENSGLVSAPSPLAPAAVSAAADYTHLLDESSVRFVMDLTTPSGTVRVPISSWQGTLQTENSNYLQCVVPACGDYLDDINVATDFTVYMTGDLTNGGSVQQMLATSTLDTLATNRGATNWTATLSGYTAGFALQDSPPPEFDRTMTGIRSTSTSGAGTRARCSLDWLLKPGHRAYLDETTSIVTAYVNYYVNANDRYMDIGERSG